PFQRPVINLSTAASPLVRETIPLCAEPDRRTFVPVARHERPRSLRGSRRRATLRTWILPSDTPRRRAATRRTAPRVVVFRLVVPLWIGRITMLRTTRSTVLAAAVLALWTAACTDVPGPAAPAAPLPDASPGAIASPMDAVAREVPAFGGFFLDENGTRTAYLTDVSQRAGLERGRAPILREHGFDGAQLRVRPAAFRHEELQRWLSDATPEVLGLPGVVFIDNDEANNRLLIGVEDPGAAGLARTAAARLRVPHAAVEVVETEPFVPAATLRDRHRPVRGGLQIHFSNFLCTLGFNAVRSGQSSFITNSHCTATQGGVENTQYFQPTS